MLPALSLLGKLWSDCTHSARTQICKWFPAFSIEGRGKDNDSEEILERTEHNLGVQADIQELQGYVRCRSFVLLQSNGPRQK